MDPKIKIRGCNRIKLIFLNNKNEGQYCNCVYKSRGTLGRWKKKKEKTARVTVEWNTSYYRLTVLLHNNISLLLSTLYSLGFLWEIRLTLSSLSISISIFISQLQTHTQTPPFPSLSQPPSPFLSFQVSLSS